jgi:AraC-like DNA-binding protein
MMKSYPRTARLGVVTTRIYIGAGEPRYWEKLETMAAIDPSISGGITEVVLGRRVIPRGEPIGPFIRSGYEEIHEIEPGFCVHVADLFADQDWRLTIRSRENNLRFRITFAGEATYFDRKSRASDKTLDCSYIVRPADDSLTVKFDGGRQYRYCSLNVTERYLARAVGLGGDDVSPVLAHWQRRETVIGHFPASRPTLALAGRFFGSRSAAHWRDIEVRAIAYDLLRVLFENWRSARPDRRSAMRITPQERDKLARIRELIRSSPGGRYTIPALCAEFRINRKKLHYGFKRLCGVSIHDFQTELRMQLALELLRTSPLPVAQVAERAGYSEPTNFTAAFKKHFAVLPSQVRDRSDALA